MHFHLHVQQPGALLCKHTSWKPNLPPETRSENASQALICDGPVSRLKNYTSICHYYSFKNPVCEKYCAILFVI